MFEIEIRGTTDTCTEKPWNQHAIRFIQQVVEYTKHIIGEDFSLHRAILDWHSYRSASFATLDDGSIINLAMASLRRNHGELYRHQEYSSFCENPMIGSFYSRDAYDALRATIIHEIAHTIIFFLKLKYGLESKPHGWNWKIIYANLRKRFINPNLGCQSRLKQLLEAEISEQISPKISCQ